MNLIYLKFCSLFLLVISFAFSGIASAEDIRIALRANKGAEKGLVKWQATADYLSEKIPGYRFVLVPFENNSALNQAVSLGNFHFCITNPASGVEHKIRYGTQPLATLVNKRQGKGYTAFGSVIFTHADRDDINTLNDLKGKRFIAVDELGFGGWRVAWLELLENNINPYTYFSELRFAGGKQQNVVYAVRDKKVAAGSVRTDMLERMAASGKINMSDFKVLAQKQTENFPFLHSTKLYPEWMFSAVRKMDHNLKTKVIQTLFSIQENSEAAKKGKYVRWITPLDYTSVNNLLKKLKVGPYNIATMGAYKRLVTQYGLVILLTIIVFILISFAFIYVLKLNRKILLAQKTLEEEVVMRSNLERQLMHSQRIESLGQLTGGIAHDFNNMLASIVGYTELAMFSDAVKKDETLMGYLEQVLTASNKSSDLVTQMLAFSRVEGGHEKQKDIFISNLVSDVYRLLKPMLPSSIKLSTVEFDKDLFVNVNLNMMTQVIVNLYLNAKDAIVNHHGEITFSVDVVNYDEVGDFCNSCHQDVLGEFIAISIKDTGEGIDANAIEHLFEPFYTTKDVGKGTGMGLSMVHGIVHKYGGHIFVDSVVDKGTTIKILLPKTAKRKTLVIPTLSIESNIDTSKNTNKFIMIVDDEVSLTVYLTDLLQRQGFRVISFNNSEMALSYFEGGFNNIDLVITDQTMPELSGIDMAEKMFEYKKDIPIILCTGFSEIITNDVRKNSKIKLFLEKPIQSNKLLEAIYQLLNNSL